MKNSEVSSWAVASCDDRPVALGSFAKMNPALTLQFERAVNEYASRQRIVRMHRLGGGTLH
jgi:hypothetical protein